jgi:hypothetical protein
VHRLLTSKMTKSCAPAQLYEAKKLSVDLLDRPDGSCVHRHADSEFYMHNRRYAASLILQIVYARNIPVCTSYFCLYSSQRTAKRSELYYDNTIVGKLSRGRDAGGT